MSVRCMRQNNNKIMIIGMLILMILGLTGCGGGNSQISGPINSHTGLKIESTLKDNPEEQPGNDIPIEKNEDDTIVGNNIEEELSQIEWQFIEELDGKEVCGLIYSERPYKEMWSEFDNAPVDDRYYVIQNGDRFGLMNINGEWILEPQFAIVHYAYDYYFSMGYDWGDESYTFERGELRRLQDYEYSDIHGTSIDPVLEWNPETNSLIAYDPQMKVMESEMSYSGWLYSDNYDYNGTFATTLYEANGDDYKYGVITNNHPVTEFIYDSATTFSDGLIAVEKDGKWGYVDSTGKEVIPCEYDGFRTTEYYYEYNIRHTGELYPDYWPEEMVNEYIENWLKWRFAAACTDGYVVLLKDGQYALYSSNYEEIIPFGEYEGLSEVSNGRLFAKKDGAWGIITLNDGSNQRNTD